jgi:hypothetical protein
MSFLNLVFVALKDVSDRLGIVEFVAEHVVAKPLVHATERHYDL